MTLAQTAWVLSIGLRVGRRFSSPRVSTHWLRHIYWTPARGLAGPFRPFGVDTFDLLVPSALAYPKIWQVPCPTMCIVTQRGTLPAQSLNLIILLDFKLLLYLDMWLAHTQLQIRDMTGRKGNQWRALCSVSCPSTTYPTLSMRIASLKWEEHLSRRYDSRWAKTVRPQTTSSLDIASVIEISWTSETQL